MENIYFYPHEFEEVKNAIDKAYAQIFITKRISNFIELHGRNSFSFLIGLEELIDCEHCLNENHSIHALEYAENVLDLLLEEGWRSELFGRYFNGEDLITFYYWIGTYMAVLRSKFQGLNFTIIRT